MSKLCSTSKKIKKIEKSSYSSKKKKPDELLYLSFPQETKAVILSEIIQKGIQKGLILKKEKACNLKSHLLDKLDIHGFNEIIREVLPSYVKNQHFDKPLIEDLRRWRRKIRDWSRSFGKVDKRGDPLIIDEESEIFVERLRKLIPTLESRSIKNLRPKAIKIIQEITAHRGKKLEPNTFSKNFWYRVLRKHSELRQLWEKLPSLAKKPKEDENGNHLFRGSYNFQLLYPQFSGVEQNFTIRINYENSEKELWSSGQDSEASEGENIQIKTEEEIRMKIEQSLDCKIEPTQNLPRVPPFQPSDQTFRSSSFITKKEESDGEYF